MPCLFDHVEACRAGKESWNGALCKLSSWQVKGVSAGNLSLTCSVFLEGKELETWNLLAREGIEIAQVAIQLQIS